MNNIESVNFRIKELRKALGMSQTELAKKMGVSQGAVSWNEQPGNNVTESTIKSICTILNANEEFLLNGALPMFIQPDTFSLDNFIKEKGGTELEKEIVKTYFELDPEIRKAVMDHFKAKFASFTMETAASIEPSIEDMEAAYKKSVLNSAQKTTSSALNITEGTERQKKSG